MNAIKLLLNPSPTQIDALLDTMTTFNSAKNIVLKEARTTDCYNKHKLSNIFYHQLKNDFLLPSQLTIGAITTVVEDYKKGILPIKYKDHDEVFYDKRVISFKGLTVANIATTIGRVQVTFTFDKYFYWQNAPTQVGSALLVYNNRTFTLQSVIHK